MQGRVTLPEAAKILGINVVTLRRWRIRWRDFPVAERDATGNNWFLKTEIIAWAENHGIIPNLEGLPD